MLVSQSVSEPASQSISYVSPNVQTGSGSHPASYPKGNGISFPGVKRPGCEANHSSPSSAKYALVCLHGMVFMLSTGTNLPLPKTNILFGICYMRTTFNKQEQPMFFVIFLGLYKIRYIKGKGKAVPVLN
jgi:hypothetical protein